MRRHARIQPVWALPWWALLAYLAVAAVFIALWIVLAVYVLAAALALLAARYVIRLLQGRRPYFWPHRVRQWIFDQAAYGEVLEGMPFEGHQPYARQAKRWRSDPPRQPQPIEPQHPVTIEDAAVEDHPDQPGPTNSEGWEVTYDS